MKPIAESRKQMRVPNDRFSVRRSSPLAGYQLGYLLGGCLVGLASLALPALPCQAGAPSFPWHGPVAVGAVPARTLSQPATTPVEPMPPKQAYPYGWFGPKPAPQWKRSFGVSKAYTQWSRY